MQISQNSNVPSFNAMYTYNSAMNPRQEYFSGKVESALDDDVVNDLDKMGVDVVVFPSRIDIEDSIDSGLSVYFVDSFNGQAYRNNANRMVKVNGDERLGVAGFVKKIVNQANKILAGDLVEPEYDEEKLLTRSTDLDKLIDDYSYDEPREIVDPVYDDDVFANWEEMTEYD